MKNLKNLLLILPLFFTFFINAQNTLPTLVKDINVKGSSWATNLTFFQGKYYYFAQNTQCEWAIFQTSLEKNDVPIELTIVQDKHNFVRRFEIKSSNTALYFTVYHDFGLNLWKSDGTKNGTSQVYFFDKIALIDSSGLKVANDVAYFFYKKEYKNFSDTTFLWSSKTQKIIDAGNIDINRTYTLDTLCFYQKGANINRTDGVKSVVIRKFDTSFFDDGKAYGNFIEQNKEKTGIFDLKTKTTTKILDYKATFFRFSHGIFFRTDTTLSKLQGATLVTLYKDSLPFWNFKSVANKLYFRTKSDFWQSDGTLLGTKKVGKNIDTLIATLSFTYALGAKVFFTQQENGIARLLSFDTDTYQKDTILHKDAFLRPILLKGDKLFALGTIENIYNNSYPFYGDSYTFPNELIEIDLKTKKAAVFYKHNHTNTGSLPYNYIVGDNYFYFYANKQHWQSDGTLQNTLPLFNTKNDTLGTVIGTYKDVICFYNYVPSIVFYNKTTKSIEHTHFLSGYIYNSDKKLFTIKGSRLYAVLENSGVLGQVFEYIDLENYSSKIIFKGAVNPWYFPSSKGVFFQGEMTIGGSNNLYFYDGKNLSDLGITAYLSPSSIAEKTPLGAVLFEEKLYFLGYDKSNETFYLWKSDGTIAGTSQVTDAIKISVFDSPKTLSVHHTEKYIYIHYITQPFNQPTTTQLWQFDKKTKEWKDWKTLKGNCFDIFNYLPLLTNSKNLIFFGSYPNSTDFGIWSISDTDIVAKKIADGQIYSNFSDELLLYNDILYFNFFQKNTNNVGLYSTDGSISGSKFLFTSKIKNPYRRFLSDLTPFKNSIYFTYNGDCFGEELYKFPISSSLKDQTLETQRTEIFIFPNPVRDELHFTLTDEDKNTVIEIEIYNYLGQKVFSKKSNTPTTTFNIDTKNLQSGTYFLTVKREKGEITAKKFIKM